MRRLNRHAVVVCALCVLGGSAEVRASVADYLGKPIASVRLVLDGRDTTEPALVQIVETPLQPGTIRRCACRREP